MMDSYIVINKIPEEEKWHHVVASAGVRGVKLMAAWNMSDQEKQVDNVLNKFQQHMRGTANKWCARLELSSLTQGASESVSEFVVRIRNKSTHCGYSAQDEADSYITFQLIKGTVWPGLQKKLIAKGNDLALMDAIREAEAYKATQLNSGAFSGKSVDYMRSSRVDKVY
jgi:hypothetical protein